MAIYYSRCKDQIKVTIPTYRILIKHYAYVLSNMDDDCKTVRELAFIDGSWQYNNGLDWVNIVEADGSRLFDGIDWGRVSCAGFRLLPSVGSFVCADKKIFIDVNDVVQWEEDCTAKEARLRKEKEKEKKIERCKKVVGYFVCVVFIVWYLWSLLCFVFGMAPIMDIIFLLAD